MVVFLFAGQGSQYVGMGKDLYDAFAESRLIFDKADEVLGSSISKLCFEGPQEALTQTSNCQPAVFTMTIACWEAFKRNMKKVRPELIEGRGRTIKYVAGLSLGEYSALVASGALRFEDGLRLVRRRAQLMEEAARRYPGKMAAIIGLDRNTVKGACLICGKVDIANLNSPGQIVISGEKQAVDKAKKLCLEKGAKAAVDLEVSGAFHSRLMREAAMGYKDFLQQTLFDIPKIPVVSNVDARPKFKIEEIRQSLIEQVYSPVLWEDSMKFILCEGIRNFIEFGPGKVLKGLMRRIDNNAQVINIEKKEDIVNYVNRVP